MKKPYPRYAPFKHVFHLIVALSGALSFIIQLMITKIIFPIMGSSASVWIGALMFFQVSLLINYVIVNYARVSFKSYRVLWLIGLIITFIMFFNSIEIKGNSQIGTLLYLLYLGFIPYLITSSISPIVQKQALDQNKYQFYGSSNLGALIGLLGYVFLLEPFMGINNQKYLFLGFLTILVLSTFLISQKDTIKEVFDVKLTKIKLKVILWSFVAVSLLNTFSNLILQEVANFPFLWIMPLLLFLVIFALAFNVKTKERLLKFARNIKDLNLLEILFTVMILELYAYVPLILMIPFLLFILAIFLIYTIGQLVTISEDHKNYIEFYFLISLGGAMGGIFTYLIAPLVFDSFLELPIIIGVLYLTTYKLKSLKTLTFLILFGISFLLQQKVQYQTRNFYGVSKIIEENGIRYLFSGKTIHGIEDLNHKGRPLSYYGKNTPIKDSLLSSKPLKIAMIGLGSGAIHAYLKDQDFADYYEINPQMIEIAKHEFNFLKNNNYNIVEGDGRIKLLESKNTYDVLILDAFSGDNIPLHLLTKEAFQIYVDKLNFDGVILIHITNNYVNLLPYLKELSLENHWEIESFEGERHGLELYNHWVRLRINKNKVKSKVTDDKNTLWNFLKILN